MKSTLPTHSGRSFREISRAYLKREALETFIAEAAFFGVLTVIALLGLMICADALAHSTSAVCMI
jgi:hypothetical protein